MPHTFVLLEVIATENLPDLVREAEGGHASEAHYTTGDVVAVSPRFVEMLVASGRYRVHVAPSL